MFVALSGNTELARKWNEIAGTDKLTIADINLLTLKEVATKVLYIVSGTKKG